MARYHIATVGEVLFDEFPDGRRPGGAPANVAVIGAALGLKTALISAVGSDESGDALIDMLKDAGVETCGVIRTPYPTGRVAVTLQNSIPSYEICLDSAWDNILPVPASEKIICNADAAVFGSLAQRSETSRKTILELIKKSNAPWKIFDVNIRQNFYDREIIHNSLEAVNILKVSDEELPQLAAELDLPTNGALFAKAVIERYSLTELLLTRGAAGSTIFSGGREYDIPVFTAGKLADTVGAGDAFLAGYIRGKLAGMDVQNAGMLASKTAGVVCTVTGAWAKLPEIC